MSLLTILLTLLVAGVILYLINTYVPLDAKIKKIINIVFVIVVILWLLKAFGLWAYIANVKV